MNDKPENTDRRLEAMLRSWGAEEAARRELPAARQREVHQPPARTVWSPWRWVAAAAVLITAVAAAVVVTAHVVRARAQGQLAAIAELNRRQLQEDLRRARDELAKLRERLDGQDQRLSELTGRLRDEQATTAKLREELAAQKKLALSASAEKDRLTGEVDRLGKELARQRQAAAEAAKALASARQQGRELKDQLAALRKRVAAANAELTRLGRTYQQALAEKRKLENDLAALKARQSAMESRHSAPMASLQRNYLAQVGGADWAGRQAAARKAQMLLRCARLRPQVHDPAAAQLFDRLEVLLTRLELLDPRDTHAVQAFAATVKADRLARQIDAVLAGEDLSDEVRAWLAEARMILTGAERVG